MKTDDVCLAADRALTDIERERFLAHFARHRGAHAADVLSIMAGEDAYLDVIEELGAGRDAEIAALGGGAVYRVACIVAAVLHGAQSVTWEQVAGLMARIKEGVA